MKICRKKVCLNRVWNSQPPGHEFDMLTTEPSWWGTRVLEFNAVSLYGKKVFRIFLHQYFQCFDFLKVPSGPINAFLEFFGPVLCPIFFSSYWLLCHITIVKKLDSSERGMNPVTILQKNINQEGDLTSNLLFSSSVHNHLIYGDRGKQTNGQTDQVKTITRVVNEATSSKRCQ